MTKHFMKKTLTIAIFAFLLLTSSIAISLTHAAGPYTFILKWGSYGSDDGQFGRPEGIAVDSSGNVYVTDEGNSRIQKFTSNGAFVRKWVEFLYPVDIAVDSSGNVYVADPGSGDYNGADSAIGRVLKFSSDGVYLIQWGSGFGDDRSFWPCGITVDSLGNIYVADMGNNCVQKFSSNGTFITKWGSPGSLDGQFSDMGDIEVDSSGNVYVTEMGNHRVQKFSGDGVYLTQWGSESFGDYQTYWPCGITVDNAGYVYVADVWNNRFQKFTSNGTFITQLESYGSDDDGQFNAPRDIAVDSLGNLYIVDMDNNRIQKFAPSNTTAPTLTVLDNSGGQIYPSPGTYLPSELGGNAAWLIAHPDTGYSFSYFLIDGKITPPQYLEPDGDYTYYLKTDTSHTVRAVFTVGSPVFPTLTVYDSLGGRLYPYPGMYLSSDIGDSTWLIAHPDVGYKFSHFLIDGKITPPQYLEDDGDYTYYLSMDTSHVVQAVFTVDSPIFSTLTVLDSPGGTTYPSPGMYLPSDLGDNAAWLIAHPNVGYKFSYFLIDGIITSNQYFEEDGDYTYYLKSDTSHVVQAVFVPS